MSKRKLYKKDYVPVSGFFDLRCFDLSAKDFCSAWECQLFFRYAEDHKDYYKSMTPWEWDKIKEASARLQALLWQRLKSDAEI